MHGTLIPDGRTMKTRPTLPCETQLYANDDDDDDDGDDDDDDDGLLFLFIFTQRMQHNTHMLNTMIKRKVKTTCNLKYNMANELQSYSLFDSCRLTE